MDSMTVTPCRSEFGAAGLSMFGALLTRHVGRVGPEPQRSFARNAMFRDAADRSAPGRGGSVASGGVWAAADTARANTAQTMGFARVMVIPFPMSRLCKSLFERRLACPKTLAESVDGSFRDLRN